MCFMAVIIVSRKIMIDERLNWSLRDKRMMLMIRLLNDSRKGGPKRENLPISPILIFRLAAA